MERNGNAIRCAVCATLPVQLPPLETPALLALQHRQHTALFYSQSVSSSSSEAFFKAGMNAHVSCINKTDWSVPYALPAKCFVVFKGSVCLAVLLA